jgi:LacI family transcriptional regulator
VLRQEGLMVIHGKRHTLARTARRAFHPSASKIIYFITPELLYSMTPFKLYQVDELRRHLHDSGFTLEFYCDKRCRSAGAPKFLKDLVLHTRAACWILNACSAEVQRWFSKQGLPAIVAGSRQAEVDLPAINFDYHAVSVHAAGLFLRMGHRCVALVIPQIKQLGDIVTEQGFLEGFQKAKQEDRLPLIARYDGTVPGICHALASLFRLKHVPSALFISYPQHVGTALSYLIRLNLRVPDDVSLVSRQHDSVLDFLIPSIATYTFSIPQYAMRLSRMAVQLVNAGSMTPRQYFVPGEFRAGDSLARKAS